jgi:hypothetical protein
MKDDQRVLKLRRRMSLVETSSRCFTMMLTSLQTTAESSVWLKVSLNHSYRAVLRNGIVQILGNESIRGRPIFLTRCHQRFFDPHSLSGPMSTLPSPLRFYQQKPNDLRLVTEHASLLSALLGTTGTTKQVSL